MKEWGERVGVKAGARMRVVKSKRVVNSMLAHGHAGRREERSRGVRSVQIPARVCGGDGACVLCVGVCVLCVV